MRASDQPRPDVSIIITFHRERLLAHKSLLSLTRCCASARRSGISVEVIATLDRADQTTARIVGSYTGFGKPDHLLEIDVGDLGMSRNHAIQAARGHKILVCDGDDYLGEDFIVRCVQSSLEHGEKAILHPELVVHFGAEKAIWWQVGDDDPTFDYASMLVQNPWNSCCFAERSIFLETPYRQARPGETGFGFEDWHWNCETYSIGHPHRIASHTIHYVRKKDRGSLNAAHALSAALIPPTRLFDSRK